jgi:hypothetical protein
MKMSAMLVEQATAQIDAEPIPEDHPAVPQLTRIFGDHTFFIDREGLSIVEPAEEPEPGVQAGEVVKLASWSDERRTTLAPHEPEPTDQVVILKRA